MRKAPAKKQISYDTALKARALFTMAADHYQQARAYEAALAELLGYENEYCECLSDEMVDGGSFDKGLAREGIVVKPRGRKL